MSEFNLPDAALFALVTVRIAGTVIACPLLWGEAPVLVRSALVVLLSFVSYSAQHASTAISFEDVAMAVPAEFIIGVSMGFVVRVILTGVEVAGDAIGPAIGIQAGSVFDPAFQSADNPIMRLLRYGALLIALIGGAHRQVIGAVVASFRIIPLASSLRPWLSAPVMVRTVAGAVSSGVALALPLLAILFLTHIALAFVSRAAPSIQIFSVGFALTLAVGTLTLVVSLPDLFQTLSETYSGMGRSIESVLLPLVQK